MHEFNLFMAPQGYWWSVGYPLFIMYSGLVVKRDAMLKIKVLTNRKKCKSVRVHHYVES